MLTHSNSRSYASRINDYKIGVSSIFKTFSNLDLVPYHLNVMKKIVSTPNLFVHQTSSRNM